MSDGGCLGTGIALVAGILLPFIVIYAAVVVAALAALVMIVALLGAAVGAIKRRDRDSNPEDA